MKAFVALLVGLGAIALGWNYWAARRAAVPEPSPNTSGIYRGAGPGRRAIVGGPATSVSGSIRLAGGVSHGARVELVRIQNGAPRLDATDEALGDGRFSFPRVTADRYWVVARAEVDADPARPGEGPTVPWFGAAEVVSDGVHPQALSMQLHPAGTVTGKLALQPSGTAPRDMSLIIVTLEPADVRTRASMGSRALTAALSADGGFTLADLATGRYRLTVSPSGWTVDTVMVGGRDRLDLPFQLGPAERLTAAVVLTERPNQLAGTLRDTRGRARAFGMVALFAVDPDERESHRRVHLTRSDARGEFLFHGMPSGEYLLADAAGFPPDEWRTPGFFQQLTASAAHISIGRGLRRMQDVRATSAR